MVNVLGLDFESPVFKGATVVITKENSITKLKNLTYYDVVCSCNNEDANNVLRYFDNNGIDGIYTAGCGDVKIWATAKGGYSLSRTK